MIEARFLVRRPDFTLDIDVRLPARGVSAIFGPSGSGKTTLLRCIAGLERANEGRLSVRGELWQDKEHWRPTHQRPIGYVFQEPRLFSHLSVLDNLRYGLKRSTDAQRVDLDHAIALLGIESLLARRTSQLSGGESQRVSIARALAVGPRLLLMDEPLSALDIRRKQEILPYLQRLHNELDIPVLYVSHSPDEVMRLADHLLVLERGQIIAEGPLTTTLARLDLPVRLGEDAAVVIDAAVTHIDTHWHLCQVTFDGDSLWARDQQLQLGDTVRVRIQARDVSLAREPGNSSIQNQLYGQVDAIADDDHPGLVMVRVRVGSALLLARVTRRALHQLALKINDPVWVQIKSVALIQ